MKIFLGYASEHTNTAREIYDFLKTLSDDVWFDKDALIGGDDWDRERNAAQQQAELVVHLISAEIFARPGVVNREIKQTLRLVEDQPIGATYAVFVRLDNLRLPAELLRFQYVDYFNVGWREQLTQVLQKRAAQLGSPPSDGLPRKITLISESVVSGQSKVQPSVVKTSVVADMYSVSADHLQYKGSGYYWDLVNARLTTEALEGFVGAVGDFNRMEEFFQETIREQGNPHEWTFAMQEFFCRDDFLSVRSSQYWWAGGAHPNHGITTLNFLGKDFGLCSIQELLGQDIDKALRLLAFCKKVLVAMFDGDDIIAYMTSAFENPDNAWDLAEQYNFDEKGLTFNFSPYAVLPYAFGSHEIFVPWRFVTPLLDEKFASLEDRLRT